MDKLTQAIGLARAGDRSGARRLLSEVLQAEPNNELAWLWLSGTVDDSGQQRYCLEQVLRINPANQQAAAGLLKLKGPERAPEVPVPTGTAPALSTVPPPVAAPDPHPVPDVSDWTREFTGWGIWPELQDSASTAPRETGMGVLVLESGFASKRSVVWSVVFVLAGLLFIALLLTSPVDATSMALFIGFALSFWGLAIYRIFNWYVNHDLSMRIYRDGFALTREGKTETVFWREVEKVREEWTKRVYQGIIHIYIHKVEIYKKNGGRVNLDRKLTEIEKIGQMVQHAVADQLLTETVERLRDGETCNFGALSLSREGISHKNKHFIPWAEIGSLGLNTIGSATLFIYKKAKVSLPWAMENGGAFFNMRLFISLAEWFIAAAREPEAAGRKRPFIANVNYQLSITKSDARLGAQKVLYVGPPRQERRLVVAVPAGIKAGAAQRFPGYGMTDPVNGAAGDLNVEIVIGKGPDPANREATQMTIGFIILLLGMMWVSLWSPLNMIPGAMAAALIGLVGGMLIAVNRRGAGAVAGAAGGFISYVLQTLYYAIMYFWFGKEYFWELETVIVMLLSFLPGFGMFWLLVGRHWKKKPDLSVSRDTFSV